MSSERPLKALKNKKRLIEPQVLYNYWDYAIMRFTNDGIHKRRILQFFLSKNCWGIAKLYRPYIIINIYIVKLMVSTHVWHNEIQIHTQIHIIKMVISDKAEMEMLHFFLQKYCWGTTNQCTSYNKKHDIIKSMVSTYLTQWDSNPYINTYN